jgi:NADH-quinone oxidoreductase subunit J
MVAFYLLLPKPRIRSIAGGTAAGLAALVVFAIWGAHTFAKPTQDTVATILFVLFSSSALIFGTVLVAQRNPARGAIAFAFVILSTCGLFLLLAAPFLMAATVIIYAGAIIVTFLFVLMLSHAAGPSDENDRSREPLLGTFAGFAFTGLVLFTVYKNAPHAHAAETPAHSHAPLPALVITDSERAKLTESIAKLEPVIAQAKTIAPTDTAALDRWLDEFDVAAGPITNVAFSVRSRLGSLRTDAQAHDAILRTGSVLNQIKATRTALQETADGNRKFDADVLEASLVNTRNEARLLVGTGELPARNVANLGLLLYTDHLLAVELAGTLLLVATIGAVAIAGRKGAPA